MSSISLAGDANNCSLPASPLARGVSIVLAGAGVGHALLIIIPSARGEALSVFDVPHRQALCSSAAGQPPSPAAAHEIRQAEK